MEHERMKSGEILLYSNNGDKQFVSVAFKDEMLWLTQSGMAEWFDCTTDCVSGFDRATAKYLKGE